MIFSVSQNPVFCGLVCVRLISKLLFLTSQVVNNLHPEACTSRTMQIYKKMSKTSQKSKNVPNVRVSFVEKSCVGASQDSNGAYNFRF